MYMSTYKYNQIHVYIYTHMDINIYVESKAQTDGGISPLEVAHHSWCRLLTFVPKMSFWLPLRLCEVWILIVLDVSNERVPGLYNEMRWCVQVCVMADVLDQFRTHPFVGPYYGTLQCHTSKTNLDVLFYNICFSMLLVLSSSIWNRPNKNKLTEHPSFRGFHCNSWF